MIGITQDELARYARNVGLRWTASKVGDFERGRRAPTFATVLAVSAALQWACEDAEQSGRIANGALGVGLAGLVGVFDGWVELNEELKVSGRQLSEVCRGYVFTLDTFPMRKSGLEIRAAMREREEQTGVSFRELHSALQRSGLAEDRLARRLGIKPSELAALSLLLWQRTFSEERNRRAGPDANQQKKGRVSREVRAELERALADGND